MGVSKMSALKISLGNISIQHLKSEILHLQMFKDDLFDTNFNVYIYSEVILEFSRGYLKNFKFVLGTEYKVP